MTRSASVAGLASALFRARSHARSGRLLPNRSWSLRRNSGSFERPRSRILQRAPQRDLVTRREDHRQDPDISRDVSHQLVEFRCCTRAFRDHRAHRCGQPGPHKGRMDLVCPRPVHCAQRHRRHAVQSHDSDRLAPLPQALRDFGGEGALAGGDRADDDDEHRLSPGHHRRPDTRTGRSIRSAPSPRAARLDRAGGRGRQVPGQDGPVHYARRPPRSRWRAGRARPHCVHGSTCRHRGQPRPVAREDQVQRMLTSDHSTAVTSTKSSIFRRRGRRSPDKWWRASAAPPPAPPGLVSRKPDVHPAGDRRGSPGASSPTARSH